MSRPVRGTRLTASGGVLIIAAMIGLTAASVPLYRLFCQVTGYGGTTQLATGPATQISERTIKVRFDAGIGDDLPWRFAPAAREVTVRLGEQTLAFFRAENLTDQPIVGQAVFNVTPHKAGAYFDKIACFCFEEQTLQPHQAVEMPVSFYVDPAIADDPNTQELPTITLSYTFYKRDAEPQARPGGPAAAS